MPDKELCFREALALCGKCAPSSEMAGATRGLDSPQVPCCASGRLAAVAVALVLDFLAMLSTGSDFSLKKK